MANQEHLALLRSGVAAWNAWRETTDASVDLAGADLTEADLSGANLTDANLSGARLHRARLHHAQLSGANLADADLTEVDAARATLVLAHLDRAKLFEANLACADLAHADLFRADLLAAHLAGADLTGAHLVGANLGDADVHDAKLAGADLTAALLVNTNFENSTLDHCRVFGASVWAVRLAGASQVGLRITPEEEPEITVDDLEVAQFIYLLLNNEKLRTAIETITSKAVLILGRFTPERMAVLEALHAELRRRGYLPILFKFEKPGSRSTTETVLTLAAMARFIVADLTDAASVQQELSAIAYSPLTSVPVRPVLRKGSAEWSMFVDLQGKGAILAPYEYDSTERLIAALPEHVIGPAERAADELWAAREQREAEASARRAVS